MRETYQRGDVAEMASERNAVHLSCVTARNHRQPGDSDCPVEVWVNPVFCRRRSSSWRGRSTILRPGSGESREGKRAGQPLMRNRGLIERVTSENRRSEVIAGASSVLGGG